MDSNNVYTKQGVPVSVTGVAQVSINRLMLLVNWSIWNIFLSHHQVKIQGQNKEMLATACELFLGKSDEEIKKIAHETLEGHQRAIMGSLSVEVGRNDIIFHSSRDQF